MRYLIIIISTCITMFSYNKEIEAGVSDFTGFVQAITNDIIRGLNINPNHETDYEPTLPNNNKKSMPDEPTYNPPPILDNPEYVDNGLHDYPTIPGDEILTEKFASEEVSPPDPDFRSIPNCTLEGWPEFWRGLDNGTLKCR